MQVNVYEPSFNVVNYYNSRVVHHLTQFNFEFDVNVAKRITNDNIDVAPKSLAVIYLVAME